jgi:hypothetical protein
VIWVADSPGPDQQGFRHVSLVPQHHSRTSHQPAQAHGTHVSSACDTVHSGLTLTRGTLGSSPSLPNSGDRTCASTVIRELVLPGILACDRKSSGRRQHPFPGQYRGLEVRGRNEQAFLATVLAVHQRALTERIAKRPADLTARDYGSCS